MGEPAGGRKHYVAASLLALVAALALLAAGCGGQSSDQQANEAYANSVCSAIASWETQIKSIATDFSGGMSQASLESKVTQAESATKDLATKIKSVPPPDTSEGQASKQQLEQLSSDLKTTVDAAQTAVSSIQADASASTVAGAAAALEPQVKSLSSSVQSTISALEDSKGDLSSAFKSTDSCKNLDGSS
jgi:hypothetical protein